MEDLKIYTETDVEVENENELSVPALGRPMRSEFLLDPNFIQLNHGGYGTYPKSVQTAFHDFQLRSERNSELWYRRHARPALDSVRRELGQYLNADSEDLVMVPNTTGGFNGILRSMSFNPGESILRFSTGHNGVKSLIQYICDTSNGNVTSIEFPVHYPITNSRIIEDLIKFLDDNDNDHRIKIAVIDHISSTPAVVVPIQEIIPILKSRNILVAIDGAHAIGHVLIDLKQLQPDYYVTNCHKWLLASRGASVLYVAKEHQSTIHPAQISANYAVPSQFQDEFYRTGTRDLSSYLTVSAALAFRRRIGEHVIRNYNHELALEGGQLIAKHLSTQVLQEENQTGNMVDVELPLNNPEDDTLTWQFWVDNLLDRFNLYAQTYKYRGKWWARFSAQIYNDITDFEAAAGAFETICSELNIKSSEINGN